MLFAFAEAVVLTLPAAEPLAVPADPPDVGAVNVVFGNLRIEHRPFCCSHGVQRDAFDSRRCYASSSDVFAKEPEMVPESDMAELMS